MPRIYLLLWKLKGKLTNNACNSKSEETIRLRVGISLSTYVSVLSKTLLLVLLLLLYYRHTSFCQQ